MLYSFSIQAAAPPDELVTESALYKTLFEHASSFKSAAESSKEELTKLRAEVSDLRTSRKEFQDKIMVHQIRASLLSFEMLMTLFAERRH